MDQSANGNRPPVAAKEHDKSPAGSGHEVMLQVHDHSL